MKYNDILVSISDVEEAIEEQCTVFDYSYDIDTVLIELYKKLNTLEDLLQIEEDKYL